MLKQYLGLNRSTQNKLVRSEFGRFPLLLDAHTRTWSYIKYLKNKSDDSLAKISYELESSPENNDSLFVNCDKIYHEISKKNAKKESDPYKSGKSKFKLFIQNYYIDWWKIQIRGASTSASFAMHKNSYNLEPYLSVITIKKHRNALAKLRLSDHKLKIHSGRQTRPITPRELRYCTFCPNIVEDEAHFLCECTAGSDLKFSFYRNLHIKHPQISSITNKQMKYKAIMKIDDPELLKQLGFLVNKLFNERD